MPIPSNMTFQQLDEPEQLLMEILTSMQRITVMCRPFFFIKAGKLDEQSSISAHSFPKFSSSCYWTKKLSTTLKMPKSLNSLPKGFTK